MSYRRYHDFPARTLCDVFREMRKSCETINFAYMPALIEEAQHLGNKMEAALEEKGNLDEIRERKSAAKKELRKLEAKIDKLKAELPEQDDE